MNSTWVAINKIRHANSIARILKAHARKAKTFNSSNDSNAARTGRVNSEGEVVLGACQFCSNTLLIHFVYLLLQCHLCNQSCGFFIGYSPITSSCAICFVPLDFFYNSITKTKRGKKEGNIRDGYTAGDSP